MSPTARALMKNLILMVGSVVVFLGLLEGVLRLTGWVTTNSLRSPDLVTLEQIPGIFEPGQDFIDRILPSLPYRVRTNSHGFRGPEFAIPKPPGVYRILVVGDSYTLGPYVADDETMPARLEEALRQEKPGVEVVNGGVNGFTIVDQLSLLEKSLDRVDPDFVVVAFSQNDVRDMARPTPMIDLMREHAGTKSIPVLGSLVRFLQHTALFNGMQELAARLKGKPAFPAGSRKESGTAGLLWEKYGEGLARCGAYLDSRGLPWILAAWPSARQLEGADSMQPQGHLRDLTEKVGVPYFDLTPSIESLSNEGTPAFLVPLDGHPTGAGYEAAAAALAGYLLEGGFLGSAKSLGPQGLLFQMSAGSRFSVGSVGSGG